MKKITFILGLLTLLFAMSDTVSAQKKRLIHKKTTATTGASTPKDMLSFLQGRWSSLDDKKTFFQIEDDKQIDIYGRDILDTATINFYDDCPRRVSADEEKRRSGKYLVVQIKRDDFYCYSIDKISSQQLVLTYLPKGSILRYKKVPTIRLKASTPDEGSED